MENKIESSEEISPVKSDWWQPLIMEMKILKMDYTECGW